VLQKQPRVSTLNLTRRTLTVTCKPPDAFGAHRSHAQRGLQNARAPDAHHRTHFWASGLLPREHYKYARSPDPHHRTHPERPVLSIRVTLKSQAAPDTPTVFNLRPVLNPNRASHRQHTGRPGYAPVAHGQRPVRETLPRLLQISHRAIENMYIIFSKAPNSASQARREREKNPNPSLPFNLHLLLKMCPHHQVYTMMCKCVSTFTLIFFEGVKLAH